MASALLLLILAAASILGSPGPAPLSLAATGASYGFRRGLPYLAGLVLAIGIGCLAAAAGVGALLAKGGPLVSLLFVFSVGYIVFIAWNFASAPVLENDSEPERVPSFVD